jgi:hypothetical protein
LLAAPLRVILAHSDHEPFLGPFLQFLDRVFPIEQEEVIQRDTMIPVIIYMLAYGVSDDDWHSYGQVLKVLQFAGALNSLLGEEGFDDMFNNEWQFQQKDTELEQLLQRLVQWMNLVVTYDVAKPWES